MDLSYDRKRSVGYLTNLAGRLFVRALERRIPGGGAGPMPVFIALADDRPMTQTALAQMAVVEQPTMANTLKRMERDGLITRSPDPADARSALIRLTPRGKEQAALSLAAAKAVNVLASSALSAREQDQFNDMLRRIIGVLESDRD